MTVIRRDESRRLYVWGKSRMSKGRSRIGFSTVRGV